MRKRTEEVWKRCPKCGKVENQIRAGYNGSGSQHCKCKECGIHYTIDPKRHEYPEEIRKLAIKIYYGGVSGRGVGKILNMNKSNVMNWIKKAIQRTSEQNSAAEAKTVELDELYCFLERRPWTQTRKNVYKNDTFTVEGVNADLRHYIPTLARRSRCFPRKLENLRAVLTIFVLAYNRFGFPKARYRSHHPGTVVPLSLFDFF